MKRVSSIFAVLGIILILSGCGNLDLQSSTVVSQDGEGNFSFKFLYDNEISSQCTNGFLSDKKNTPTQDKVRKYKDGDNKVDEYKVHFNSIQELNKKVSAEQDDIQVNIKEHKGITKTTYTYEMNLKKPITPQTFKSYITQNSDSIATMSQDDTRIQNFLEKVSFTNTVQLPGKIISSNAAIVHGNTLTWNYYINQITPNTIMTASYEVENKTNKVVIEVLSVATVIGLTFILYRRIKSRVS